MLKAWFVLQRLRLLRQNLRRNLMILTAFAKFLQSKKNEIVEKKSCTHLLLQWVKEILSRVPENNVEKVIHTEIAVATNPLGDVLLIAKSESGRKLMNAL